MFCWKFTYLSVFFFLVFFFGGGGGGGCFVVNGCPLFCPAEGGNPRRHSHGPLAERLMHTAHKSGNTSGVSKSSPDWLNYTGFLGDVRVTYFNVPPGNKDAVMPNPLTKEESPHVYNCDDKRFSGSTKHWILKSM